MGLRSTSSRYGVGAQVQSQTMELTLRAGDDIRTSFGPPVMSSPPLLVIRR